MLEELKATLAAATPGEWMQGHVSAPNQAAIGTGAGGWLGLAQVFGDTDAEAEANARLIALMKNHLPALIECVEALENIVEITNGKEDFFTLCDNARAALAKLENNDAIHRTQP